MLKSLIFYFVQFCENVAKHQAIINNNYAKRLHPVKNNNKQNKQTKKIGKQKIPFPSTHYAFHHNIIKSLVKCYLQCTSLYCMILFY